jgi:hypothetical protein
MRGGGCRSRMQARRPDGRSDGAAAPNTALQPTRQSRADFACVWYAHGSTGWEAPSGGRLSFTVIRHVNGKCRTFPVKNERK